MSLPDPAEISPPRDPADYRRRPLMGVSFWLMMVLCVACVAGGVALAQFGPRLLDHRPARPPATPAPHVASPEGPIEPAAPTALIASPDPGPPADIERLSLRVATLESEEARIVQGASAALAAAALVEASQASGPFAAELASLQAVAPASPELTALARLAEAGAPSRAALAADFPQYAAHAVSAARAPGEGAGLGARIAYALSRVVSLRQVGDVTGDSVDAVLARAERQVADGDLDRALHSLDSLPPAAREALAPWRLRAERRAAIDLNARAVRARALQSLAGMGRTGG